MSLAETETECAANAVAPRVRLADIEGAIRERFDTTAREATDRVCEIAVDSALSRMSLCILVMHNGFIVIGKSAPAAAANFNRELGKKLAYEDAIRQLWPLMGFALCDQMAHRQAGSGSL